MALAIMFSGMAVASIWCLFQAAIMGNAYPFNTFLFLPSARFSDFTDSIIYAIQPNPYVDPFAFYLPLSWVFYRICSVMPCVVSVTIFFFVCLGSLFLLLDRVLDNIVRLPWLRATASLSILAFSYPVLIAVDRGNPEIFVALLIALALFLFTRNKYWLGMICLVIGASFKMYPALFLVLLLRQRKLKPLASAPIAFLAILFLSVAALELPLEKAFVSYRQNVNFLSEYYTYSNVTLESSGSLWNTYKVGLVSAIQLGLLAPMDFSFDTPLLAISHTIYVGCSGLLALVLVVYVCLVEKDFLRCAASLLLFLSCATPFGADYRLLFANIGLVAFILMKTKRPNDFLILMLLALTMVPKKELILDYLGPTETGYADVSVQVILNPLFVFTSLCLLLWDSFSASDWRWIQLRARRLLRTLMPWLPAKVFPPLAPPVSSP